MLFEMATGNMTFRIHDNSNDELKNTAEALNKIAEELQKINAESEYITACYQYHNLIQLTFVLDNDFVLLSFNNEVPLTLKYNPDTIVNTDFGKLIAQQSKDIWKGILDELNKNSNYNTSLQLILITGDNHLLPSFCTVSRLLYSDEIIVSSVSTMLEEMRNINESVSGSKIRKHTEVTAVQNLHDYILIHLDEPLPTLHHLARMFAIEEHILKNGFRTFFKTSVYSFYQEERLKRANLMIQQTSVSLKEIAYLNGFKGYLNFYKAFKKRFGYKPSDLSRPEEGLQS
ncbi:helix-turn-helix domain-containing protein [Flavobacterium sp. GP15]|uniref:helix-turn-helix domain-containing protein n=1 Tax=Flavobacterium sp. GP15 TaxID=2758567 RepID=UPI00165D7060|nr:helix-turn-helix domain-containing protein [Flavobacterium sp. GP15]